MRLIYIAGITWIIAGYFWGYQTGGPLAASVPGLAGGVTHVMYWHVQNSTEDKEIRETRNLNSVYKVQRV